MQKYLTEEQHKKFDLFLRHKGIKRTVVARILELKSSSSINGYFERNTFRFDDFKKVRKVIRDKALEGFEEIEFKE